MGREFGGGGGGGVGGECAGVGRAGERVGEAEVGEGMGVADEVSGGSRNQRAVGVNRDSEANSFVLHATPPVRRDVDLRLIAGSVLFGVGWGELSPLLRHISAAQLLTSLHEWSS